MPRRRFVTATLLAAALFAAACGSPAATTTTTSAPTGSSPVTTASEPVAPSTPTGTDATVPPEGVAVTFDNADGQTLVGRRFGDGTTFVVLAHMKPATMESWFPFATVLADAGLSALAFDFRGYGDSEGDGFAVDVDTIAAVDEARRLGAETVYVIGASMGGTGAIAAAAERPVAGVATLSAPARFAGVDAVGAAASVNAPMILIAAEEDDAYVDQAEEIAARAAGEVTVVPLSGSQHGTNLFREHGDQLEELLLGLVTR